MIFQYLKNLVFDIVFISVLLLHFLYSDNKILNNICKCLPAYYGLLIPLFLGAYFMLVFLEKDQNLKETFLKAQNKNIDIIRRMKKNKYFKIYNNITNLAVYILLVLNGFCGLFVLCLICKFLQDAAAEQMLKITESNQKEVAPAVLAQYKERLKKEESLN